MPAFSYDAVDAEGRKRRGLVEAETARAARSTLRTQGLIPMDLALLGPGRPGASADGVETGSARWAVRSVWSVWSRPVWGRAGLAIWTRQLAGLVSAGLPLERALTALADEADEPRQRALVATLRAEVNSGASFARALAQYPREFSPVYRSVVAAGEQSGHLGSVLDRLASDLEDSLALRAKLLAAALYPAIVSVIALLIVLFLVSYVVPQVAQVFAGSKRALPLLTVLMLGLSDVVRSYGLIALLLLGVAALGARRALRVPGLRLRFDTATLKWPLAGRLARDYNAARFASTLAMLTGAGVPLLQALQAAAQTLGNQALRTDALAALALVREGAPLAAALASSPRFPSLLTMFTRLGEQTGTLPLMLQRVARQLSDEVQRRALNLATLLEPLLIVGMGGVVMLIVLAVLLPIIELNQLVR